MVYMASVLIEDILSFARTGAKELSTGEVNIKKLIFEKLSLVCSLTMNKLAKVEIEFEDTIVNCHSDLIGLLFFNLINNGLKFNNSDEPKVICKLTEFNTEYLFSVCDNGIGINPEHKDEIFHPFKKLLSDNYEGSGLGLSICERIVKLHGGKIWLENNPIGGSNFMFTISKNI